MNPIEKWADRVYAESDFGRSVATSLSGLVGLLIYLYTKDWVIAAFSTIIAFPVVRILSTGINEKRNRRKKRDLEREQAEYEFSRLSPEEREVLEAFVRAGGSVLTWTQMNQECVSSAGVESLIQRQVMWTSMTADGMTETFAIDPNIFDVASDETRPN